jgi:hypothetical protein
MGSVNMWEHGRRTDAYRGKHRILGENLSLARQHIYTNVIWNALGFKDKAPDPGYAAWLDALPKHTVTWFAKGDYDRLLVTVRDRGRVIGLPLINGGESQHENSPYYPIPYSPGMLSGVADGEFPQLLPRFTLADGGQLAALAYFRDAKVTRKGATTLVTYRQSELDRMGGKAPVKDARLAVSTTYILAPGRITRTDVYTPAAPLDLKGVEMMFATFSRGATVKGGVVTFAQGDARSWTMTGLDGCTAKAVNDPAYRTPTGPLNSLVTCKSGASRLTGPLTVSWTLTYK